MAAGAEVERRVGGLKDLAIAGEIGEEGIGVTGGAGCDVERGTGAGPTLDGAMVDEAEAAVERGAHVGGVEADGGDVLELVEEVGEQVAGEAAIAELGEGEHHADPGDAVWVDVGGGRGGEGGFDDEAEAEIGRKAEDAAPVGARLIPTGGNGKGFERVYWELVQSF